LNSVEHKNLRTVAVFAQSLSVRCEPSDHVSSDILVVMKPFTLELIEAAIRASFALDTCSPDDLNEWSEQNRSRGHCAVTTLVLHDFFGGELVCAEVHAHGERFGYHWWNRLGGFDLDLTRDQFAEHEIVGEPWATERPRGTDHCYGEQYLLFRARVWDRLGI
jgi:hypothetical protein